MRALVPDSIKPFAAAKSIVEPLRNSRAYETLLLMLGMAITLLGGGYQFGLSNHTVYLIAPLRQIDPEILKVDWWATSTLQYHAAFTQISAVLMKWGIIQEAFLLGYLALVVLLHLAWWRLNRLLGGSGETYLLSVIFFYISAAGFGLGLYRFLQDSAMLPSNIANVAMLWAICFYAQRRIGLAGLMLGLSGLFHLNHAIVAPLLWAVMTVDWLITTRRIDWRWWAGCAAALGLSVAGIAPVFREILNKSNLLPLGEFVDLYVRLRHPHHYEPVTWAWPYWLAFLWPIPLALLAFRRMQGQAAQKIRTIFLFFMVLQLVALIFAGVWFVHEWLIQMSLYRFSIFPKLISCIGAAILLINYAPRWSRKALLPVVILSLLAVMILNRGRGVLLHFMPQDDMEYVAMCNWASDPKNTPRDAIFIVPPHEHCFRLYAQRAIVVNMKAIPQLSGELAEWRRRLEDVLGPESMRLDHQFDRKLRQIEQSYESLPAHHLAKAARKYNARYIVIAHEVTDPSWHLAHTSGRYRLYQIL